jgi:four helix bundle protein
MGDSGFRNLRVWRAAKELAVMIYRTTARGPLSRDYSLRDQLRRAAISIPSNIAEDDERDTNRDSVRFLYNAKGSLAELRTQLEIALEVAALDRAAYDPLESKCSEVGRMLGALIKVRSRQT